VERTPDLRRTRRELRLVSSKWDELAWRSNPLHLEERFVERFRATWYIKTTWNESADVRHAISFLFPSPRSSQDHDQGVAGGFYRDRQGAEDQPHHR
jgi:hypothetical protein